MNHDVFLCGAVLVYAVCITTNAARARGGVEVDCASQMMIQFIKDGVKGHPEAMRDVDNAWETAEPREEAAARETRGRSRSPRHRMIATRGHPRADPGMASATAAGRFVHGGCLAPWGQEQ